MNYFELYDLPVAFVLDESTIKRKFYALSKRYHPDFYTLESEERQAEILELSTLNNEAYKILSDADKRMHYILKLKGIINEEGQTKLPQEFLMEMMEINEQLMELEFDFEEAAFAKAIKALEYFETELYDSISPILSSYKDQRSSEDELNSIKEYYYKKRYLLRIRENLNKFATR